MKSSQIISPMSTERTRSGASQTRSSQSSIPESLSTISIRGPKQRLTKKARSQEIPSRVHIEGGGHGNPKPRRLLPMIRVQSPGADPFIKKHATSSTENPAQLSFELPLKSLSIRDESDVSSLNGDSLRSYSTILEPGFASLILPKTEHVFDAETGEPLSIKTVKWSFLDAFNVKSADAFTHSIAVSSEKAATKESHDERSISSQSRGPRTRVKHARSGKLSSSPSRRSRQSSRQRTRGKSRHKSASREKSHLPKPNLANLSQTNQFADIKSSRESSTSSVTDPESAGNFLENPPSEQILPTIGRPSSVHCVTKHMTKTQQKQAALEILRNKLAELPEKDNDMPSQITGIPSLRTIRKDGRIEKLQKSLEQTSYAGFKRTEKNVQALAKLRDRLFAQMNYLRQEEEFEETCRQDELQACTHAGRRAELEKRHERERQCHKRHLAWFKEDAEKILAKKLAEYDLLPK